MIRGEDAMKTWLCYNSNVVSLDLKNILPAINASLIGGLVLYFSKGEIPPWSLLVLGIFFTFGKDIKERLVKWFTKEVSIKVHKIVFGMLAFIWIIICSKHLKQKYYEIDN